MFSEILMIIWKHVWRIFSICNIDIIRRNSPKSPKPSHESEWGIPLGLPVGEGRKRARTQNWGKRVGHQLSSWAETMANCWDLIPGVSKMFPPLLSWQILGLGMHFPVNLALKPRLRSESPEFFMHCRCRELAKDRLCEDSFRVHYVDLVWLRFWWRHQTHSLFVVP